MAFVSVLMSMISAFFVSMTAWVTGSTTLLEAFGLYLTFGFGVTLFSFGFFLTSHALRTRSEGSVRHGAPVSIPALAVVPVRSKSS